MVYALLCTLMTTALTALVALQYYQRQRPYQLAWAISLLMAAVASLAYAGSVHLGGNPHLFRVYYWLGGQLMAATMGMGSLYLAARPSTTRLSLISMSVIGLIATYSIWTAPLDYSALAALSGGSGRGIVQMPALGRVATVILNVFGTMAVAGIAVASAVRFIRRELPVTMALGNWVIAAGVFTIGAAGSAAGVGRDYLFWPVMTLGWLVFFAGFLIVNRGSGYKRFTSATS